MILQLECVWKLKLFSFRLHLHMIQHAWSSALFSMVMKNRDNRLLKNCEVFVMYWILWVVISRCFLLECWQLSCEIILWLFFYENIFVAVFLCMEQRVTHVPRTMYLFSSLFLKNRNEDIKSLQYFSSPPSLGDLVELSKAKYSRNIVKKFLMYG